MKFIFTADWHFSLYTNDKIIKESNLPERLDSLIKTITNIINYARSNKIKIIIVGGDVLHNKSIIYSQPLAILIDLFKNNSDIDFILIDGNHDMSTRTLESVSALKSFNLISNVHTVHEIEKVENILLVSWKYANKELFIKENSKYLLSHFGLNEAKLNSGISVISDVSINNLSNFNFVLLGHYHREQFLKSNHTNLYYVGSPIQLDNGEKNELKRFLVVDTDNDTIESIPTEGYKKYCELNLSTNNKFEILKEAEELKKNGHHVKVNLVDDVDTSDFSKDLIIVDKREKDITNRGVSSEMSMSDKLEKYLEIKKIPKEKWELYKNKALEIIEGSNI